jgi:hypothetical protein
VSARSRLSRPARPRGRRICASADCAAKERRGRIRLEAVTRGWTEHPAHKGEARTGLGRRQVE